MVEWTEKELERFQMLVCSEQISASCEGCTKTKDDIDNCYQELMTEIETA